MRQGSLCAWIATIVVIVAGCSAGNGTVGSVCTRDADCGKKLQCVADTCQPLCTRSPQCGDGFTCATDGSCQPAEKGEGERCSAEPQCAAGLSCQLSSDHPDQPLSATCSANLVGKSSPGETCTADGECTNGTCALGHCVDLCDSVTDCTPGETCTAIPRVEAGGKLFQGCLPATGAFSWSLHASGPQSDVLVPVPAGARSLSLVMSVDDPDESVGVQALYAPDDTVLYQQPCDPGACGTVIARDEYYMNLVRHSPTAGMSVLEMPSSPRMLPGGDAHAPLPAGLYRAAVSSFSGGGTGASTPHVAAVARLDSGSVLDLHFYFLDLDQHPCAAKTDNLALTSATAQTAGYFQNDYLGALKGMLRTAGITIGEITYEDLDAPALDGLDIADAGTLFEQGTHATGVNIFFVRTLSPAGLQAYGPNPGPAGRPGTSQSGIAISLDTLCYRDWAPTATSSASVARITAHEIARYLGLYHNVEPEYAQGDGAADDGIDDDDTSAANLMFYSELGGTQLTDGQRAILSRSPVLQ